MMALAFPILTFDATKLAPTWGYVFDRRWLDPVRVRGVHPLEVCLDEPAAWALGR